MCSQNISQKQANHHLLVNKRDNTVHVYLRVFSTMESLQFLLYFLPAAPPSMCEKDRRRALGWDNKPKDGVFVPDCKPDGSYNPVQCLRVEGPCWCVDKNGKEIVGTRNENGKPVSCPGRKKGYSSYLLAYLNPTEVNFETGPKFLTELTASALDSPL